MDMRPILPHSLPLALLPESTHKDITRFFHHSDRKLAFGSQILQRLLVCRVLFGDDEEDGHERPEASFESLPRKPKKELRDVDITKDTESGRPSYTAPPPVTPPSSTLRTQRILEDYNVSHSSGIVILAARVSDVPVLPSIPPVGTPVAYQPRKRKIGVDVVPTFHSPRQGEGAGERELTDEENEEWLASLIGSGVFTKAEEATILSQSSSRRKVRCLYLFWALKEAYVKAVGTGLVTDLLAIEFRNVRLFDLDEAIRKCTDIELWISGYKVTDWYLEVTAYGKSEFNGEPTHYLAVASEIDGLRSEDEHAEWEILDFEKDVLPYGPFPKMSP